MKVPSGNSSRVHDLQVPSKSTTDSSGDVVPYAHPLWDTDLISNQTRYLFEIIVYIFLNGVVSIIGIANNIVNIIVFYRQGILVESSTTSLMGLAVSDFCCLATILWHSINQAIMRTGIAPRLPWDPSSVLYIMGAYPHKMFTRVTCWITVYIALERCVCVTLPFKVKTLFTPRRSLCVNICIFIFFILCYTPIYYSHQLQWRFIPGLNVTKLVLHFTDNKRQIDAISIYSNGVVLPTASLVIITVCTKITISKITISGKWRKSMTSPASLQTTKVTSPNSPREHQRKKTRHGANQSTTSKGSSDAFEKSTGINHTQDAESSACPLSTDSAGDTHQANQQNARIDKQLQATSDDRAMSDDVCDASTRNAGLGNTDSKRKARSGSSEKSSKKTTSDEPTPASSQKEKKLTRMMLLICLIFLATNTPAILVVYTRFTLPEMVHRGRHHNLFHLTYSLLFLLEIVNSSINIIVYYTMSSRYKLEFNKLFCIGLNE